MVLLLDTHDFVWRGRVISNKLRGLLKIKEKLQRCIIIKIEAIT